MNTRQFLVGLTLVLSTSALAPAQHVDIEFSYENDKIDVLFGPAGRVFTHTFPTSGISEQLTSNPGFASEVVEGLGIPSGHTLDYNILGPIVYHNGTGFAPVPATVGGIRIKDNPGSIGALLVTSSTSGSATGPGVIGIAEASGDFHSHIDYTLEPPSLTTPEYGAYGLLMNLSSYESDGLTPTGIADSDSFFIVFNFGLSAASFQTAVDDFSVLAPEPGAWSMAAIGGMLLCLAVLRKQRRNLFRGGGRDNHVSGCR